MDGRLRIAGRDDYAAIERLWQAQNRHHTALEPERIRQVPVCLAPDDFSRYLRDPDTDFVVFESGHGVVGFVMVVERRIEGGVARPRAIAFVQEICVAEVARRGGIGRRLMDHVESWARRRGLADIYLNVWARNRDALAFYDSLGFSALRLELCKPVGRDESTWPEA
jgi:ribosomal protein S18 acetylase RimI-like enzyme